MANLDPLSSQWTKSESMLHSQLTLGVANLRSITSKVQIQSYVAVSAVAMPRSSATQLILALGLSAPRSSAASASMPFANLLSQDLANTRWGSPGSCLLPSLFVSLSFVNWGAVETPSPGRWYLRPVAWYPVWTLSTPGRYPRDNRPYPSWPLTLELIRLIG